MAFGGILHKQFHVLWLAGELLNERLDWWNNFCEVDKKGFRIWNVTEFIKNSFKSFSIFKDVSLSFYFTALCWMNLIVKNTKSVTQSEKKIEKTSRKLPKCFLRNHKWNGLVEWKLQCFVEGRLRTINTPKVTHVQTTQSLYMWYV